MPLPHEAVLLSIFAASEVGGWTVLEHRSPSWGAAFRTSRFAKVMPSGELQFTIGATARGESAELNRTIRELIVGVGVNVVEGRRTAGSKRGSGEYPALNLSDIGADELRTLIHRIEGAVAHVASSAV